MIITDLKTSILNDGWRNLIFVELETDSGITGIGEATLANRTEAVVAHLHTIKQRYVIGSDPFNTEAMWQRIYMGDFIRGGMIAGAALSAVDIACHDIMGKALGVPVCQLLGGQFRESAACYANGWYTGARTPEAVASRALEVLKRGYTALKIDPFGAGAGELSRSERALSVDIIQSLRQAVGPDIDIFVEAHARFVPMEAIRICKLLEPFDIGWFEEPCTWDDPMAWREVKDKVGIPIAGGEHFSGRYGYRTVIENRCVDILQPDVLYCGGLTEMRKICAWADAYNILVAPHNSQGPVCTTASAHLAIGMPNFKVLEVFDDCMPAKVVDSVPGCLRTNKSHISVSERPGLGIELNRDSIEQSGYEPAFFNLFAVGWESRFQAPKGPQ